MSDPALARLIGVLILTCVLPFYFLPTIVAASRQNRRLWSIFVINLLVGWTLVGWVAALVWASAAASSPTTSANLYHFPPAADAAGVQRTRHAARS